MQDFIKDPQAALDYVFDWSEWLEAGEEIASATITVSAGITIESTINGSSRVTVWVSGGIYRITPAYKITCHIITNSSPIPREDDRTINIYIREK
jgi:hypothetical protein